MLALLTWRDFGWRLHSRLGVDFRRKGATQRRHVYSAQAVFVTLIKFDVMWEVRHHPTACHESSAGSERYFRLWSRPWGSMQGQQLMACRCFITSASPPPQISLTAVAIALAKAHQSNMPQAERLLAINLTGLFTNLIIGWGAWTVVRHRTFRTCAPHLELSVRRGQRSTPALGASSVAVV